MSSLVDQAVAAAEGDTTDTIDLPGLPPIEAGSIAAQVLLAAWQGTSAMVVTSPPGAGKTTLLAAVGSHLATRGQMTIAIACQTNIQARDLANRFRADAPSCPVALLGRSKAPMPPGLDPSVNFVGSVSDAPTPGVTIATTKKWQWVNPEVFEADILLVDEAYQATWADFAAASPVSRQVLLVGDPGQIPPVVTGDVRRFQRMIAAPHLPSPTVLAKVQSSMVKTWQLPHTRRCGPDTAKVLQPLYPFSFGSRRADRHLQVSGHAHREIGLSQVESYGSTDDPDMAQHIEQQVRQMLAEGVLVEADGSQRKVQETDVAVVAAHNAQVSAVRGRLSDRPNVTVATTERLQGAEFPVVVAWSPQAAKRTLGSFDVELGRLCVMLSRHTHHLVFVERHDTREVIAAHVEAFPRTIMGRLSKTLGLLDEVAAG